MKTAIFLVQRYSHKEARHDSLLNNILVGNDGIDTHGNEALASVFLHRGRMDLARCKSVMLILR